MSQQVVKKLSATKQKLSLGEVKKTEKANAATSRKIIRTTVINPEEFDWPFISEKDENELIECLTSDFQVLKQPNHYVPLDVISKVENGDRRQYRHMWHNQRALEVGFDVASYAKLRGDISLGVNCVSTGLELDVVKAVIIDKDVEPPILTKLLLPIARSKVIPIVAISGLSKTCQNVFKIRCIVMGFKANCDEISHHFFRMYNLISVIAKKQLQVYNASASLILSHSTQKAPAPHESVLISSSSDSNQEGQKREKRSQDSNSESFKPPKIRKV